ncbi:hypothetical protein J8TS2_28150 [Lederbergia ruris]|uniref:HNH endonuclease n=1 Tax=Lederbergia ruris TaxID=217495 RepID=A0ABQ4KM01_9BACI|nr:hypothetical protein J8TS2_28150 [Lederbergia ruris]
MATRPYKPCNKQGCPELVQDGSYCDRHKDDRVKYYDKYERNQESCLWQTKNVGYGTSFMHGL